MVIVQTKGAGLGVNGCWKEPVEDCRGENHETDAESSKISRTTPDIHGHRIHCPPY